MPPTIHSELRSPVSQYRSWSTPRGSRRAGKSRIIQHCARIGLVCAILAAVGFLVGFQRNQQNWLPSSSVWDAKTASTSGTRRSYAAILDKKSIDTDPRLLLHGLDSYNSTLFPVFSSLSNASWPIQVQLIVGVPRAIEGSSKILMDGISRSPFFDLSSVVYYRFGGHRVVVTSDPPADSHRSFVYLVDWGSLNRNCHILERLYQQSLGSPSGRLPDFVVLFDYSGSPRQQACLSSKRIIPKEKIRLVKRSVVQGRAYQQSTLSIDRGSIAANQGRIYTGGPTLHAPMVVRESFVETVQDALLTLNHNTSLDPFQHERTNDLAFFWDIKDHGHYGFLRRQVANIVRTRRAFKIPGMREGNRTLTIHVGHVETMPDYIETGNIQEAYVQELLLSKIVVVAQRDEWEDHYRLMESLATGALVFTDSMLALPNGLENKTSILVYDNEASLKRLIRYYLDPRNEHKRLAIAQRGFEVAMTRHRSWHRLEEVFFGRIRTPVDTATWDKAPSRKDYMVRDVLEPLL